MVCYNPYITVTSIGFHLKKYPQQPGVLFSLLNCNTHTHKIPKQPKPQPVEGHQLNVITDSPPTSPGQQPAEQIPTDSLHPQVTQLGIVSKPQILLTACFMVLGKSFKKNLPNP